MGRPSKSRTLAVSMNGARVARWTLPSSGPMELVYEPTWLTAMEARPLSLSLPMPFDGTPLRGDVVAAFFDNLLPDSEAIRRRVQDRFRTRSGAAFDLLAAVGRDCVGALQLVPEGEDPGDVTKTEVRLLDEAGVERWLHAAVAPASGADDEDDFRISIAGAQEKTALTWHRGRWGHPRGATPSTHLFKLPLGLVGGRRLDLRASLENEWLCAHLLAAFGVPVAEPTLATFGRTKALVVPRFDRVRAPAGHLLRLPQEDFCQATGTPSSRKYEADGGPGLPDLARVLATSEARDEDLATLFRAQVLFYLLAATDGHAKNWSLRLLRGNRHRLTPLYDVLSAWPVAGPGADQIHPKKLKLAMALRGTRKHYRHDEIRRDHFVTTARACGLGDAMEALLDETLARVEGALADTSARLPPRFPERVFATIAAGMRASAKRIAR